MNELVSNDFVNSRLFTVYCVPEELKILLCHFPAYNPLEGKTKEKIGITTRGIIPDTKIDRNYNENFFKGYKKEIIPIIKYIPASEFPFKGEITVYGNNKISIINLNKEYLTGIIIEDETIHNMMKMIFELSWNSSKVSE